MKNIAIIKYSFILFFLIIQSYLFAQRNIYHIAPSSANLGEDLTLKVSLIDIEKPIQGTLYYRLPGGKSYLEIPFADTGFNWEATIPSFGLTDKGIEYLISFEFLNNRIISYPRVDPFNNPIFVQTIESSYGFGDPLEADVLILSPNPNSDIEKDEAVIAVSFFNAEEVNKSSVSIFVNGEDRTNEMIFDGDILIYSPSNIIVGSYSVEIQMRNTDGLNLEPIIWSFNVIGYPKIKQKSLTYYGRLNSKVSIEKISDNQLSIAELSGNITVDARWAQLDTDLRISSKESVYNQPFNRLGNAISFGRFLEVNMGDQYPQFTPLTIDGKRVRGLGVDLDFNWLRFQFINGELNRPVQRKSGLNGAYRLLYDLTSSELDGSKTYYLDRAGYEFKRDIVGARLSTKILNKIELGAHILKIRDDTTSVKKNVPQGEFYVDSTIVGINAGNYNIDSFLAQLSGNGYSLNLPKSRWKGEKPKDNVVLGFNIGTFLDDRKIAVDFDWNLSLFNKDIWDGALTIAQLDTTLDDSLDGYIGRIYDEDGKPLQSTSEISTDQILFNPESLKDFFIINTNMTPLVPIDLTNITSSPIKTIINMPSSAFRFSLKGNYSRNNIMFEYQQLGPEYRSLANPFLRNNTRKITISNRVSLLDQKIFINIGFKHLDNKILKTVVNPLNTNTFYINATFFPGSGLPSFSYNYQNINKNNEKTKLDSVGSRMIDLREDSDASTSMIAFTIPFNSRAVKNNLTINLGNVINLDNFSRKRSLDYLYPKTDSRSFSLNLSSVFSSQFRTYSQFNRTNLEIPSIVNGGLIKIPFTWTSLSFSANRKFFNDKLLGRSEISLLSNQSKISSKLLGLRLGVDYDIQSNLSSSVMGHLKLSYVESGINNMQSSKGFSINSSGVIFLLNYKF